MNKKDNRLYGSIKEVNKLSNESRKSLFRLMDEFYIVDETAFFEDLNDKDTIILLKDSEDKIRGFSSAKLFSFTFENEKLNFIFSGDTIIHPDYWGTLELPKLWGKFMLKTIAETGSERLFWLLISSGYKTYRFLPAYFHEFFPRFDQPTPEKIQKIMNTAAKELFGKRYDPENGIIKLENPTPIKGGLSNPDERKQNNPHIAFFLKKNPGFGNGDELSTDNIKPFVKRLIRAK